MAILQARDEHGETFYWTGRANGGWISPHRRDAIDAYAIEGAKRQAEAFNRFSDLHGLTFYALPSRSDI